MELETLNGAQVSAQRGNIIHHLGDPTDVVVGGTKELNQALERILPEHPCAAEVLRELGEPGVGGGEGLPDVGEGNGGV